MDTQTQTQSHPTQPRDLPPLPPGIRPRPISNAYRPPASSITRRPRPPPPPRQTSDIVLPPWQPDSSASNCPICSCGFTFFNRRHHCRKCGRVVCQGCSPHRITIPKAFVVQPPQSAGCSQGLVPVVVGGGGGGGSSSGNTRAHRASWSHDAGTAMLVRHSSDSEDDGLLVRMCDECLGPHTRVLANRRQLQTQQSYRTHPHTNYGHSRNPQTPTAYHNSLPSRRPPHNYYPVPARRGGDPFQLPPQQHLKETDYCPICTSALPPIGPDGSEEDREAHIQNCIRQVEHSVSPGGGSAPSRVGSGSVPRPGEIGRTRRYTGGGRMVVWKATEKDTWASVDDDEDEKQPPKRQAKREKAECVICFEEFEEGDIIARLECLCRYHKKCIRAWFDRRGNGECPVHAVHE
ncbi:FYVE zinc finger-domain-containing protein [Morchella snyderi]|nr:FYVE zinc finger-domain-containing protein [Morchella snyderi]